MTQRPPPVLDKTGYELEIEDDFNGTQLNERLWIPRYLPHWTSGSASLARYALGDGKLRLLIEADQPPWCPEFDGWLRVSACAIDDPRNMVALWMIGYEDQPERAAEICIFEIFGRDMEAEHALVGVGVHPFGDQTIRDEFTRKRVAIDARTFHVYAAEWSLDQVAFYVDDQLIHIVNQSPAYPMQLMLGIYEFADGPKLNGSYPKEFVIDWFRAYRRR